MTRPIIPTTEGAGAVRPGWLARRFDRSNPGGLRRTLAVVGAGAGLAFFGGVLEGINGQSAIALIDRSVSSFFINHRSGALTPVFETITGIAGVRGSVLLVLLVILLLWRKRRLSLVLVGAAVVEVVVAVGLKLAVGRQRPDEALRLVHETSFSFPSGHTLGATVIWGLLAYFVGRSFKRRAHRVAVVIITALAVVSVAVSRIYLGAHYPSDTLASLALGGAMLCLGLAILAGHEDILPRTLFTRGVRRRILAAFGIGLLAVLLARSWFI